LAQQAGGLRVAGEQQQAGGGAVQAVHGVDVVAAVQLAGVLQGELGFVFVDGAAVYQQTRGLVHGQQPVVPVQLGQRVVAHAQEIGGKRGGDDTAPNGSVQCRFRRAPRVQAGGFKHRDAGVLAIRQQGEFGGG